MALQLSQYISEYNNRNNNDLLVHLPNTPVDIYLFSPRMSDIYPQLKESHNYLIFLENNLTHKIKRDIPHFQIKKGRKKRSGMEFFLGFHPMVCSDFEQQPDKHAHTFIYRERLRVRKE